MDPWCVNNITVIAFYPGGCGNRYLRKLQNKEYSTSGVTYDKLFSNQKFEHRYLLADILQIEGEYCLTHCINYRKVKKLLNPTRAVFIKTDFKKSLRREWVHDGIRLYKQNKQNTNQTIETYNAIRDVSWPEIINIDEFNMLPNRFKAEVTQQLSMLKVSEELDSAWSVINWHHEYYAQYPLEMGNFETVNDVTFMNLVNVELDRYSSPVFDFCWNVYTELGKSAPIVELYDRHIALLNLNK